MSIVQLRRVMMVGHATDKEATIEDLQEMGCCHLVPLSKKDQPSDLRVRPQARDALQFLLSCPRQRRQITRSKAFNAEEVERQALALQDKIKQLEDERDLLVQRKRDLQAWGDFALPPAEATGGQRFWFYAVPHRLMPKLKPGQPWSVVGKDHRFAHVIVVSPDEPADMPVPRLHTGNMSARQIRERLEDVESEIEALQDERAALTRWCMLFAQNLGVLEDRQARGHAAGEMLDDGPLFATEAWAPVERAADLEALARKRGLACEMRDPVAGEEPPTELRNPPASDAGEGLVTFYMVPGYSTWDPSAIVLYSFAIFFGMILSDAGYGMLLGILLIALWKKLSASPAGVRFRRMLTLLTGASMIYGVLVGSYFGIELSHGSALHRLTLLNVHNLNAMMALSVAIGVAHIALANFMNAWNLRRSSEALAPVGWAIVIISGFLIAVASKLHLPALRTASLVSIAIGALLVFLFTGAGKKPLARCLAGLGAFSHISGAFGDVLSYLRLFALGLASASLAEAFNEMAGHAREAVAGGGLLLMLLILLIGHSLNFILAISSAVIHGLRLNLIEFFNWSLTEEGRLFRPFKKKESAPWNS